MFIAQQRPAESEPSDELPHVENGANSPQIGARSVDASNNRVRALIVPRRNREMLVNMSHGSPRPSVLASSDAGGTAQSFARRR
jgi:hypothetical protein